MRSSEKGSECKGYVRPRTGLPIGFFTRYVQLLSCKDTPFANSRPVTAPRDTPIEWCGNGGLVSPYRPWYGLLASLKGSEVWAHALPVVYSCGIMAVLDFRGRDPYYSDHRIYFGFQVGSLWAGSLQYGSHTTPTRDRGLFRSLT